MASFFQVGGELLDWFAIKIRGILPVGNSRIVSELIVGSFQSSTQSFLLHVSGVVSIGRNARFCDDEHTGRNLRQLDDLRPSSSIVNFSIVSDKKSVVCVISGGLLIIELNVVEVNLVANLSVDSDVGVIFEQIIFKVRGLRAVG